MAVDYSQQTHTTCIRHIKWAPCLVKADKEERCVLEHSLVPTEVVRAYHLGTLLRPEVEEVILRAYGIEVEWTDGVA